MKRLTWEAGPLPVADGLWDDVTPWQSSGGDLSAQRGAAQVWGQGELTPEAPGGLSQGLKCRPWTQGPKDWGGAGKLTGRELGASLVT